jgi:nucleoside-diphosphate-sugar epimerase
MRVLVIGSRGYVGSYLVPYLHLQDNSSNQIDVVGYGSRVQDYNNLTPSFLSEFSHIVLLAGHSSVPMCNGPLSSPWKNNVRNFHNLIEKTNTSQKIVYASSASVYGNKNSKVFTEDDLSLEFINNYDLTKITLDMVANSYKKPGSGRKIIGLRFGTVNGGSRVIRRDLMINCMVWTALTQGVINVTNSHINRPILSIKDLSRAVYTVLTMPGISDIYNLVSFNSTVAEIAQVVSAKTGIPITDRGNTEGVYNFATDSSKFQNSYGFKFLETLEDLVDDVINCYKNRKPTVVSRDEYFNYD